MSKDLKPWERYNIKKEERMTKEELINALEKVYDKNHAVGACLIITFLTNSRVCEVVRYRYIYVKNIKKDSLGRKIPLTYETRKQEIELGNAKEILRDPIKWKDIWVDEEDGEEWLHIITRVEKGKDPNKVRTKEAVILLDEDYYLFKLLSLLASYLEEIGWTDFNKGYIEAGGEKRNVSETHLFTFSDEFVRKKLVDTTGLTPHVLRNIRSGFLVLYEGFTVQDLMDWTGWISPELAIQYSRSNKDVIKKRMREVVAKEGKRKEEEQEARKNSYNLQQ